MGDEIFIKMMFNPLLQLGTGEYAAIECFFKYIM